MTALYRGYFSKKLPADEAAPIKAKLAQAARHTLKPTLAVATEADHDGYDRGR